MSRSIHDFYLDRKKVAVRGILCTTADVARVRVSGEDAYVG